jgi:hypothetical protein
MGPGEAISANSAIGVEGEGTSSPLVPLLHLGWRRGKEFRWLSDRVSADEATLLALLRSNWKAPATPVKPLALILPEVGYDLRSTRLSTANVA